jgi:hypothetical protein
MMNDDITSHPSKDDLEQKWAASLMASERAIHHRYTAYCDLKRLLEKINTGSIDVADYYLTAVDLGARLSEISCGYGNTVFHYFAEQIDPRKNGDVRCFRMECRQLSEQFEELDRRRANRRPLRVIK